MLLFGPPGVGKGTQAQRLSAALGVPAINAGEIFRDAMRSGTALGRHVARFMDSGEFVPDDVVLDVVERRLGHPDARHGYVLDGFPRTVPQAESFRVRLRRQRVDRVVVLEVPPGELVARIAGRRTCLSCQTSYHVVASRPQRDGRCDRCGDVLVRRPDDAEAPARRRLADYATTTAPVLDFLRARGWPICVLSGVGSADEVHRDIVAALGIRDHAWPVPTTCADAHPARGSTDRRTAELVP